MGCFELFAREGIHSVADLKGRSVGVGALGNSSHIFLAATAAHIGLDPAKDIHWVTDPAVGPICCMLGGNKEFVSKCPVATKRALRAILKATDLCVSEPASIARQVVERGFTDRYDFAVQALSEVPYDRWREYDPEDTIRSVSYTHLTLPTKA